MLNQRLERLISMRSNKHILEGVIRTVHRDVFDVGHRCIDAAYPSSAMRNFRIKILPRDRVVIVVLDTFDSRRGRIIWRL
jgi:translation initiation factor IF-1